MSRSTPELILVHGLGRKPPAEKLEELWRWGLDVDNPKPEVFGYQNLGIVTQEKVRISVAYWADVFHEDHETDLRGYYESVDRPEQVEGVPRDSDDVDDFPRPQSADGSRFVDQLMQKFAGEEGLEDGAARLEEPVATPFERVPLPGFVKKRILKQFATEAYHFLYQQPFARRDGLRSEMRQSLRSRLIEPLKAARERSDIVVVLSHSMGTMIAYDCLRNAADCPDVSGLITLGSPLGVDEIQDPLIRSRNKMEAFPQRVRGPWINVFDPLDPICALDPRLANDFLKSGAPAIRDIHESNWGEWRHTITHYLAGPRLRAALRELAGL